MKVRDIVNEELFSGEQDLTYKKWDDPFTGELELAHGLLRSFKGGPKKVTGHVTAEYNALTTLEGAPRIVGGVFNVSHNRIESFKHSPEWVGKVYDIEFNHLRSFEFCPKSLNGSLNVSNNYITSLEHAPSDIGLHFNISYNNIGTLKDIHKIVKNISGIFNVSYTPIKSGYLDILKIENPPSRIKTQIEPIANIINKHLKNENLKERVKLAMVDFIEAELEEWA